MPQDLIAPGRLRLGVNPKDAASYIARVCGEDAANPQHLVLEYYNTSANAPTQDFQKARGSVLAPADAAIGDRVIDIRGLARSTTFQLGTAFRSYVDGPGPLVAGQNPPQRIGLQTNLQNAASREVVFLSSEGYLGISDGLFTATERPSAHLHILGQGGDVHIHVEKVVTDANPPLFEGFKARGTVAGGRANVTDGDAVARFAGFAYSNTYLDSAMIQYAVDGAVTAGQAPPSRMELYTNASNVAPTLQASLRSNGMLYIGSSIASSALLAAPFPTDGHVFGVDGSARHVYLIRASAANGYNIGFMRSRGTFPAASLANVQDGDRIARIESSAYSGATGFWAVARMDTEVDGAVVDNQRPGSKFRFFTNVPNSGVVERMAIQGDGIVNLHPTIAAAAGGSLTAALTFGTAPGVLGVYWGSGAPSISAPKGSLYLRTDGSGTTNRAYIATNGTGTWTALTTVA